MGLRLNESNHSCNKGNHPKKFEGYGSNSTHDIQQKPLNARFTLIFHVLTPKTIGVTTGANVL